MMHCSLHLHCCSEKDGWMDGWIGWKDGWMDKTASCMHALTHSPDVGGVFRASGRKRRDQGVAEVITSTFASGLKKKQHN